MQKWLMETVNVQKELSGRLGRYKMRKIKDLREINQIKNLMFMMKNLEKNIQVIVENHMYMFHLKKFLVLKI
jgi:hypothetical protein